MPSNVLILTATISPPATAPGVVRLDPAVRLEDYRSALRYYAQFLGSAIARIVFVENSGSDLDVLEEEFSGLVAAGQLTTFQTNSNDFPPVYGRCYGEVQLLDAAMQSTTVQAMPHDTIFWKVTGRYKLKNLCRMIGTRPAEAEFYMDLRNARGARWADMRVFSWTKAGYAAMLAGAAPLLREDLRGSRPGEEAAYDVVSDRMRGGTTIVCTCFRTEPDLDGVRAFDNRNWSAGRQRLVSRIRQAQRTILGRVLI